MNLRRDLTRRAEALLARGGLTYAQLLGLRFAVNVFLASSIVWFTLWKLGGLHPIWAIASMVAASDPEPEEARRLFRSRLINVLVGSACGLAFLLFVRASDWLLPLALAGTVLVSTTLVRIQTMWRQGPITAAVVIAAGITTQSAQAGFEEALFKVAQVVYGCLVGLLVSWAMAKVWLVRRPPAGRDVA